jgi:hypothetical protein
VGDSVQVRIELKCGARSQSFLCVLLCSSALFCFVLLHYSAPFFYSILSPFFIVLFFCSSLLCVALCFALIFALCVALVLDCVALRCPVLCAVQCFALIFVLRVALILDCVALRCAVHCAAVYSTRRVGFYIACAALRWFLVCIALRCAVLCADFCSVCCASIRLHCAALRCALR